MSEPSKSLNPEDLIIELKNILMNGRVGLEKESLRVNNSLISNLPHPNTLGSSLCNQFITTDFSEAQPELITPPFDKNILTLDFLENIHHYFFHKNPHEILWPFSLPPFIENEDIPIAKFGNSS